MRRSSWRRSRAIRLLVSKILWRYNDHGLAGLGDGRLDNPGAAPLLDPAQLEELRDVVSAPPPDGGVWSGRKVALWITGRTAPYRRSAGSSTCIVWT